MIFSLQSSWRVLPAAALLLAVATMPAHAGARRNLPGFSTNVLAANDDDSAGPVNIGFTINFFGSSFSQLYVNNNGNVTFTGSLPTFTPFGLLSTSTKIIAPFFADVDTRGPGSGVVHYGNDVVNGHNAFGVEWPGVGYYADHSDKLNSFELVLIDRSDTGAGNFDIEFNYDQIQWETGDASNGVNGFGGFPARAGYSNGSTTAFEVPGSGVSGALVTGGPNSLTNTSLGSSVLGRSVFSARNGTVNTGSQTPIPGTFLLLSGGMLTFGAAKLRRRFR